MSAINWISKRIRILVQNGPHEGKEWELSKTPVTIGRAAHNDIVLDMDNSVSRSHVQLKYKNGAWHLIDQQSANGTFLGIASQMCRVSTPIEVDTASRIQIGNTSLFVEIA